MVHTICALIANPARRKRHKAKRRRAARPSCPWAMAQATWSRLRILFKYPWPNCSRALCCRAISRAVSREYISRFIVLTLYT
jgi:hypothetical protein